MSDAQERFIGVRPNGTVCGPCMDSYEDTMMALIMGYKRTTGDMAANEQTIKDLGYRVSKCLVTLVEG